MITSYFESQLPTWFNHLIDASFHALIVAFAVFLVISLLGRRLSARFRYTLWLLPLIPLIIPTLPNTYFSVFNLAPDQSDQLASTQPADPPVVLKPGTAPNFTAPVFDTHPPRPPADPAWTITLHEPASNANIDTNATLQPQPSHTPRSASPTIAPASTTPHPIHILLLLWGTGAAFLILRLLITNLRFTRRLRRATPITDPRILAICKDARIRLNLNRPVQLLQIPDPTSPALAGLVKPKLLLPTSVIEKFSDDQVRFIVLHELAHAARRDLITNFITSIISIIHWFNPAVWLASSKLNLERELICDQIVLENTHQKAHADYGHTILKVIDALRSPTPRPLIAGIESNHKTLRRRLAMIINQPTHSLRHAALGLLTLALISALTLTHAKAQSSNLEDPASANAAPNKHAKTDRKSKKRKVKTTATSSESETTIFKQPTPARNTNVTRIHKLGSINITPESGVGSNRKAAFTAASGTYHESDFGNAKYANNAADPASAKTASKLETKISLNFNDAPFTSIIEHIRSTTDADIILNWKRLRSVGISQKTKVTVALKNVTASHALKLTLHYLLLNSTTHHLSYTISDGVIVISPRKGSHPELGLRVTNARKAKALDKALQQKITVDFTNTPLSQALDTIRKSADINISVAWPSLQTAGIGSNTPVSLKLRSLSAKKVINFLLGQLSDDSYKLSAMNFNGVYVILAQRQRKSSSRRAGVGASVFGGLGENHLSKRTNPNIGSRYPKSDDKKRFSPDVNPSRNSAGLIRKTTPEGGHGTTRPFVKPKTADPLVPRNLNNPAKPKTVNPVVPKNLKPDRGLGAGTTNPNAKSPKGILELSGGKRNDMVQTYKLPPHILKGLQIHHDVRTNSLVVRGPAAQQKKLAEFLKKAQQQPNLRYDMKILLLKDDTCAETFQKSLTEKQFQQLTKQAFVALEPKNADLILRKLTTPKSTVVLAAPKVATQNNQKADIAIIQQLPHVTDYRITKKNGDTFFHPVVKIADLGMNISVTGKWSPDGKNIITSFNPKFTTLDGPIKKIQFKKSNNKKHVIEIPQISKFETAFNFTSPPSKPVIIHAGVLYGKTSSSDKSAYDSERRIIILVTPSKLTHTPFIRPFPRPRR